MKIAVLGPVVKDTIIVDDNKKVQMGGIPYYVSHALNSLGGEVTAFVNYGQKDDIWAKKFFNKIDFIHIPSKGTMDCQVKYFSKNPNFREHKIIHYPNKIKLEDVKKMLEDFDCIIFGPLLHDNIDKRIFSAFPGKLIILGNFGMFTYHENDRFTPKDPQNMIDVMPYLDYLFLDENEIKFVSGKNDLHEAVKFVKSNGVENVIVTLGSEGSLVFIKGKEHKIPAYPPSKLVDPTGAGDTYLAAFVRALSLFNEPEKQGKFAAMAATFKIEKHGALDKNVEEIYQALNFRPK